MLVYDNGSVIAFSNHQLSEHHIIKRTPDRGNFGNHNEDFVILRVPVSNKAIRGLVLGVLEVTGGHWVFTGVSLGHLGGAQGGPSGIQGDLLCPLPALFAPGGSLVQYIIRFGLKHIKIVQLANLH